ncbi:MAG: hypothetical protein NT019_01075 [Candidatus Adlerbacteria bacterium]|nr:hypothetical protein [Candidatus Adlerbacteria bacterium]
MHEIKLPKVLFLVLVIARHFHKKHIINTNDLADLANKFASELVRLKKTKKDYKSLEDTKFGGLRGNFSTVLTFRGMVKRGSRIISYYGIGRDDRILNALLKGEIVLRESDFTAHTNNEKLKDLLETEAHLLNVREDQAHIKLRLEKGDIPLKRDDVSFPKESVVYSPSGQYFIRGLFNNYINRGKNLVEYNITNLWFGTKFKKKNIHLLLAVPSASDSWDKIYAVKNEELIKHKPLLLIVDVDKLSCTDKDGNNYRLYPLEEALLSFSKAEENISERLAYNSKKVVEDNCEDEVEDREMQEDEFSIFLEKFLHWGKLFSIDKKDVIDIKVSSSGGPDVRLIFSGGTTQALELEHNWKNYIDHGHPTNGAFSNCWIFAEENWDPQRILKLFRELKKIHGVRIPDVFLCLDNGVRKAYRANWDEETFEEIDLDFPIS